MIFEEDATMLEEEQIPTPDAPVEGAEPEEQEESAEQTQDPQELLRALKEDRERDRLARESLQEQNEFFRAMALQNQNVQKQQQAASPKLNNDDLMTYGDFEEVFRSKIETVDAEIKKTRGRFSEELARQKFPDYEDVIDQLVVPMVKKDPTIWTMIENSENPALTAYRLGCSTPEYIAYQRKTDTKKVTDKIEKNLSKPKTLGSVGASQTKYTPGSIAEMSSDDFARLKAKALGY